MPGREPLEVCSCTAKVDGVIGSPSVCGIKNSAPVVKICRLRPAYKSTIALNRPVSSVASSAASSNDSPGSKLKKSATRLPHKVEGRELAPPKYKRPS